jgi:hypothetical protein
MAQSGALKDRTQDRPVDGPAPLPPPDPGRSRRKYDVARGIGGPIAPHRAILRLARCRLDGHVTRRSDDTPPPLKAKGQDLASIDQRVSQQSQHGPHGTNPVLASEPVRGA